LERGISFIERDISKDMDARRELMKRKVMGVPAFIIDDEVVVGPDMDKIESLLDYNVTPCSGCNTKLRIPKDKGKIAVTCPKCNNKFETTT
jgi:hypothetical protein